MSAFGVANGDTITAVRFRTTSEEADPLGVGALQHHRVLQLVVQDYIPTPVISSPIGYFRGDNRGPDTTPGVADNDYRTRLAGQYDFDTAGTNYTYTTDSGVSIQYQDAAGTIELQRAEAREGVEMDHRSYAWAKRVDGGDLFVRLEGVGLNPLATPYRQLSINKNPTAYSGFFSGLGDLVNDALAFLAVISPSIDYGFTVQFDSQRSRIRIFTGRHDGFPAYEVFARYNDGAWTDVYSHDPVAANQTPYSLFGRGEFRLSAGNWIDLSE